MCVLYSQQYHSVDSLNLMSSHDIMQPLAKTTRSKLRLQLLCLTVVLLHSSITLYAHAAAAAPLTPPSHYVTGRGNGNSLDANCSGTPPPWCRMPGLAPFSNCSGSSTLEPSEVRCTKKKKKKNGNNGLKWEHI